MSLAADQESSGPAPREPLEFDASHSAGRTIILELIEASARHETLAQGPARRVAYRTTRHLLGGATRLGVTYEELALTLGVSRQSIRNRSSENGIISAIAFAQRAELTLDHIRAWRMAGQIELVGPDPGGTIGYQAAALLRAFVLHRLASDPRSRRLAATAKGISLAGDPAPLPAPSAQP